MKEAKRNYSCTVVEPTCLCWKEVRKERSKERKNERERERENKGRKKRWENSNGYIFDAQNVLRTKPLFVFEMELCIFKTSKKAPNVSIQTVSATHCNFKFNFLYKK